MYALVALVVISIAPDKMLQLVSPNRFATEQGCEEALSRADVDKLVGVYKTLGLDAEVRLRCVNTGQKDI